MQNGAVKVSISTDQNDRSTYLPTDIYIYRHRAQSLYPLLHMREHGVITIIITGEGEREGSNSGDPAIESNSQFAPVLRPTCWYRLKVQFVVPTYTGGWVGGREGGREGLVRVIKWQVCIRYSWLCTGYCSTLTMEAEKGNFSTGR